MKDLSNANVLITGGTGSIGREILTQILSQNVGTVVVFSRDETKQFMLRKRFADERLKTVVGDVRDLRSVGRVFEKYDIDVVYHAAALKHVTMCEENPMEAVSTNVIGTRNVVEAARKSGVPTLITVSTDKAVYPLSVMGATKLIAERITLNSGYTCVRFGNVVASRGSVIPALLTELIFHKSLTVTDPGVTRFLMRIEDAARLVIESSKYARGGETFILKMKAFRLGDLVEVIRERIAPKLGISPSEVDVRIIGLRPGEKMHEELLLQSELSAVYEFPPLNSYVILPSGRTRNWEEHWDELRRTYVRGYSSNDAEFLSLNELQALVEEYLHSHIKYGETL